MIRRLLQKLLTWIEEPQINVVAPLRWTLTPLEELSESHYYSNAESNITDYGPEYKTDGAAGFDICAYLYFEKNNTIELLPHDTKIIPTGLFVEIPKGYELQIRPRSGLATKGVTVMNSPGTIDSDYRGEIRIIIVNHSDSPFIINDGDRIAQGIVTKFSKARFNRVSELTTKTKRGIGGFGHTGI